MSRFSGVRASWERSYPGRVVARLGKIDGANQAMLLGANVMLTLLPLFVLLGLVASRRVDDDLALHMGLDKQATQIVSRLFTSTHPHFGIAVVIAAAMLVFWTLGVVASLQTIYERVFELDHRGMRDVHRFVTWMVALCFSVVVVSTSVRPAMHAPAAPVLVELITFCVLTPFIWWTIHFLLAGRVSWRRLLAPAVATGICTVGLGVFSKAYFSSTIVSDSHLYGSIGAVFSIVTWLIATATVVVLGAVAGAEWNEGGRVSVDVVAASATEPERDGVLSAPRARS